MVDLVVWNKLTISLGDRVVRGSYAYEDGLVTINTPVTSKTAQIGNSPPKVLARIMLWELANEGKA